MKTIKIATIAFVLLVFPIFKKRIVTKLKKENTKYVSSGITMGIKC